MFNFLAQRPLYLGLLFTALHCLLATPLPTYATVGWETGEMVLDFGNEVESGEPTVLVGKHEVGKTFDVDLTWEINDETCQLQIQKPSVDGTQSPPQTVRDDGLFNGSPSHAFLPQIEALLFAKKKEQPCKIDGSKDEFITIARQARPVIQQTEQSHLAPIGAIVMVFRATGFFTPHEVTIKTGEKVVWIYADGASEPHSVTSGTCRGNDCSGGGQAFNSGPTLTKPSHRFEHVFTKAGIYPYHCDLHQGSMQGTVIVEP